MSESAPERHSDTLDKKETLEAKLLLCSPSVVIKAMKDHSQEKKKNLHPEINQK